MSNTPRKAAVTKVQRCVMTLGGLSVAAGAALTFGFAGPAAAQTHALADTAIAGAVQALPASAPVTVAAEATPAIAGFVPKADGMPMPHHMRHHHHHKCHHHHHGWHHDGWDHDGWDHDNGDGDGPNS